MNPAGRARPVDRRALLWWALALAFVLGGFWRWVYPFSYGKFITEPASLFDFFTHLYRSVDRAFWYPFRFGAAHFTPFAREVLLTCLLSLVLLPLVVRVAARLVGLKNPPAWRTTLKLALLPPLLFLTTLCALGVPLMSSMLASSGKEPQFYRREVQYAWRMEEKFFSTISTGENMQGGDNWGFGFAFDGLSHEIVPLFHRDGRHALVLVHLRSPSPLVLRNDKGVRFGLPPHRLPQAAVFTNGHSRYFTAEETPAVLRAFPAVRKAWLAGDTDVSGLLAMLPSGHVDPVIPEKDEVSP